MEKELEHTTGTGSHMSLRSREEDARSHRRGRWREELEHRTGTGSHLSLERRRVNTIFQ